MPNCRTLYDILYDIPIRGSTDSIKNGLREHARALAEHDAAPAGPFGGLARL